MLSIVPCVGHTARNKTPVLPELTFWEGEAIIRQVREEEYIECCGVSAVVGEGKCGWEGAAVFEREVS